ncbi:myo-inositol-1(or 4)-monophosphatase [Apiospora kogelbergensis]|uniref:Inositol-1-monophosphatase n=1 Tax=Apiospora kogelbergensis TaxID=1337665 RepID=A0AAW0QL24_9PEZI
MADLNLEEIRDTLVTVAYEAGRMILSANPTDIATDTKLNSVDIVTEADKAVEAMVSGQLQKKYPSFDFMGEETYKPGQKLTASPTFIVDPIDGTTNFVHGFPSACISLGLAVDRTPTIGVVYNPYLDQLYTAIRGKGAFLTHGRAWGIPSETGADGGEKGRVSRLPLSRNPPPLAGLGAALVAVEWGNSRDGVNYAVKTEVFRKLCATTETGGAMVHSLRSLGSAALNLCAVAAGQLDAYWEGGCWAWDVCAGWTILAEAGGVMAGGNPGVWEPQIDDRKYLAVRGGATPEQQKELVRQFWDVMGDMKMDY